MPDDSSKDWLEQAWADREERLYTTLFRSLGPGIYPLDADIFTQLFRQDTVDPRWLFHGVFECPPARDRASWLYVSSGLSNAWDADFPDPNSSSGLGCEFVLQCKQQSQWALTLMRRMVAFQILLSCGRFPGKPLLSLWDRIPLRSPIDGKTSNLTWALITPAIGFEGIQQIASGKFEFLQFVGVTEKEANYAREQGGDKLLALLIERDAAPIIDPERESTCG
ncbi:MAG TPA: suppressor of fused domain protein [Candidatus Dormibacteraeota bacterium]|nr:suppressor of fused domain protein [Candidatus Dormibacteraeota bacterium]